MTKRSTDHVYKHQKARMVCAENFGRLKISMAIFCAPTYWSRQALTCTAPCARHSHVLGRVVLVRIRHDAVMSSFPDRRRLAPFFEARLPSGRPEAPRSQHRLLFHAKTLLKRALLRLWSSSSSNYRSCQRLAYSLWGAGFRRNRVG